MLLEFRLDEHKQLEKWLFIVAFASLVAVLYQFFQIAVTTLSFPYPLGYGEGPLIDQAQRLASFKTIYRDDISVAPYTISNYPPLFPLLQVPFFWIFGPNFFAGRAISLLSILLATYFTYGITFKLAKSRFIACTSSALFLGSPFILSWCGLARVDSLALMLCLLAFYLVVSRPCSGKFIFLAALAACAAIYTRQSYIVSAIGLPAGYLLLSKTKKSSLLFASITIALGLIVFLLINLITSGGFYLHIVKANINELEVSRINFIIHLLVNTSPVLLVMALGALTLPSVRRNYIGRVALLALICSIPSLVAVSKVGSMWNYCFEFCFAMVLAASAFLISFGKSFKSYLFFAILLLAQVHIAYSSDTGRGMYSAFRSVDQKQLEDFNKISGLIAQSTKPVLADTLLGLEVINGKEIYFQPFIMTQLAKQGIWDDSDLVKSISNKDFGLICIETLEDNYHFSTRWTPAMQQAIENNYTKSFQASQVSVFVPK